MNGFGYTPAGSTCFKQKTGIFVCSRDYCALFGVNNH